ncbi:uncharacterized protein LOC144989306 [Oryzias latipes]
MVERKKKEGECPAIPTPRPPPHQQRQPESPQRHTGTGREQPPPGRPNPPPRPGPAGPPQGPQSQRAGRHGGKEGAAPAQPGEQPPRRAGRTQRRAPPEKDAHSPRRAPHHHPGVPGIPPPQPQVRARTPQGRPTPHSRQPSARPTVGPGRSEAGARRPRPEGGNPGEKRGPTRGVVNMARPGSATVGNLAGPSTQEQGPEPTPQGHEHPRLRCNVNPPTARREHRRAQEAGTPGTQPPLQRGPYPQPGKRQGTDGPRSHLPCKMCVRVCVFERVCVCMCVCLCWDVYIEGGGVCVLRGVRLKLAGRALRGRLLITHSDVPSPSPPRGPKCLRCG